jgi:hypothetical protein
MIPGVRSRGLALILPLGFLGAACQLSVDLDTLRQASGGSFAQGGGGAGAGGAGGDSSGGSGGCLCVDPVPAGWDGYFVKSSGPPGGTPAACPDDAQPIRLYQGAPNAVSCNACACGAPAGAACAPPLLACNESSDCTGPIAGSTSMLSPGCNDLTGGPLSCQTVGAPAIDAAGSCAPSGGGINKDPRDDVWQETWDSEHRLCAADLPAGGCASGPGCATMEGPESLCIRRSGLIESCPSGFGDRILVYQSASDTRDCSECECGAPLGLSCSGGGYTFYDSPLCDAAAAQIGASCSDVSGSPSVKLTVPIVNTTGAQCPSTGGLPAGSFDPEGPVTLCCL